MMYSWWDGSSALWYGMVFGPVIMVAIIILTGVIIAWLLRALGLRWQPGRKKSALDILRDRLARGDIDRAEYEERRRLLSGP